MRLKIYKGKKVFYSLICVLCFLCSYLVESLCFFCFLLSCILFESPQLGWCKYRCAYMNRVVGTSVFSTFTLEGLFSFFIFFSLCAQKAQKNIKRLQANKNKKGAWKHLRGEKATYSLICAFVLLLGCVFVLLMILVLLVCAKSFRKKK